MFLIFFYLYFIARRNEMKNHQHGFSLLELVIVMAILSVILCIFLPILDQISQRSLIIQCRSNLRQLGIAYMLYAQHHHLCLPHGDRDSDTGKNNCWFDRLDPYLDNSYLHTIKQCPAWSGYNAQGTTVDKHSLKMNGALCPKERLPETQDDHQQHHWYWPRLWDIRRKIQTVLMVDGRMDNPYDTHTDTSIQQPYHDIENRHMGGANLLFVDGSCCFVDARKKKLAKELIGWVNGGKYLWHPYQKH